MNFKINKIKWPAAIQKQQNSFPLVRGAKIPFIQNNVLKTFEISELSYIFARVLEQL